MEHTVKTPLSTLLNATVIITGLGYFVDMYDLFLFNVTRVASLTDMGLTGDAITETGVFILNMQLFGLVLGSFCWGILADRLGRKSCLLASIVLYSIASLLCGIVQTPEQYTWLRFFAGFALAGEVGLSITLITERMTPTTRGKGVALFAALGFVGILCASFVSELMDWRTAYIVGGVAGLVLLVARSLLMESTMFEAMKERTNMRGDLRIIFTNPILLRRYVCSILAGVPITYCVLLYTFSPEIALSMGIAAPVTAAIASGVFQVFLIMGDFGSALVSDRLRSRKKTISIMKGLAFLTLAAFVFWPKDTPFEYYFFMGLFGLSVGYWVLMNTIAAEQFGTNIRGTAATTIPNLTRASVIVFALIFKEYRHIDTVMVVGLLGLFAFIVSGLALKGLQESYGKALDYNEK